MDELMAQFIVEARELVKGAIDDLLASDVEAENADRLNGAFRAVHTLKGSVGLFDMPVLQSVLHRAENSLESVRAGARTLDEDQTSALIAVLEWVESCVDDIEHHGSIGQTLLIAGKRFDNLLEFEGLHREEAQGTIMPHTPAWLEALATKVDDTCTVALPQVRKADPRLTIAVLSLGEERVGLIVDSVSERAEMVTKPLDGLLTGARGIAGTTVLGDGQVLLVLNVAELIQ